MKFLHKFLVATLSAATTIAVANAQDRAPNQAPTDRGIRLTGLTLIDGTGAAPRSDVSILIRGERIVALTAGTVAEGDESFTTVSLAGSYCTPGLCDVHTHVASSPSKPGFADRVAADLRQLLGRGITDVRDMGGDGRVLTYLKRQTALGDLTGPDIHFAALLAGPRFFGDARMRAASLGADIGRMPWGYAIADDTDLDGLMQQVRGIGASGIKIYADLSPELVARVATAAKAQDLAVWSHWVIAPRRTKALDAVQSGVEVVSHAYMLMYQVSPPKRVSADLVLEGAGGSKLFAAMVAHGTILDATLIAASSLRPPQGYVAPSLCGAVIAKAAHEHGVRVATGSDHPGDGTLPGIHHEYRLLVDDAGFTPMAVIEAATRISCEAIGIESQRGTIEVGKEATLLIFDGDPSSSVEVLATPRYVIKRGMIYDGEQLRDRDNPVAPLAAFPK